jgi:hypothetical protein
MAIISVLACSLATPGSAAAQDGLAVRVSAVRDGEVRMRYEARPGVCAWDRASVRAEADERRGEAGSASWRGSTFCPEGPVRVALTIRDGQVTEVRNRVGSDWDEAAARVTDLGVVSGAEAGAYLLDLAERSPDGRVGANAIFAAVLGKGVQAWPALLRISRAEGGVPRHTQSTARFWLGQEAAGETAPEPRSAGRADDRDDAVYALFRLPDGAGIPELLRLVRESPDRKVRRSAIFWLSSTRDPRALALFEELLRNR